MTLRNLLFILLPAKYYHFKRALGKKEKRKALENGTHTHKKKNEIQMFVF